MPISSSSNLNSTKNNFSKYFGPLCSALTDAFKYRKQFELNQIFKYDILYCFRIKKIKIREREIPGSTYATIMWLINDDESDWVIVANDDIDDSDDENW